MRTVALLLPSAFAASGWRHGDQTTFEFNVYWPDIVKYALIVPFANLLYMVNLSRKKVK